jgi:hypothetical protein
LWERPELRVILAERDIGALFEQLQRHGFSQRRIASLVGMSLILSHAGRAWP